MGGHSVQAFCSGCVHTVAVKSLKLEQPGMIGAAEHRKPGWTPPRIPDKLIILRLCQILSCLWDSISSSTVGGVGLLISQVWSVFRRWLFWHLVWSLTRRQSRSVRYWLTSNKLEWVLRRLSSPAHFKYLLALILWSISVLLAGKITTCMQCTPRSEDKSLETGAIGGCELPCGC